MNVKRWFFTLTGSLLCLLLSAEFFPVPAGKFNPQSYTAFRPVDELVIDGNLTEESWKAASWSELFTDIEGDLKPKPFLDTRVKMLWDDDALYIAAEMHEDHIWASLTERDAVIFQDNDFEVFIDPDGDTHDYYELEINALGTLWDLFLIKPYRDRQQVAVNAWDIRNCDTAIGLDGTLNDPTDIDRFWRVEMKIPLEVLKECAHKPVPPPEGDFWRINFSRVHWDTYIQDGKYIKQPNQPEHNWVWSPQGLIAMHYPERWGYLFFSHHPVNSATAKTLQYGIPELESARQYLRQLYYKQKQFYMNRAYYAKNLRQLKAAPFIWKGKRAKLKIEVTSQSYIITLSGKNLPRLHIREDGLLWE